MFNYKDKYSPPQSQMFESCTNLIYLGDKRYKCKICEKQFIQIGTIKRHCETHDIPPEGIDSLIIRVNHVSKVFIFEKSEIT